MKKHPFLLIVPALIGLLTGCSTPLSAPAPEPSPEPLIPQEIPVPVVQSPLPSDMQRQADEITRNGGLAALGVAESRSLELALNMAKKNGRLELARITDERIEALAKAFSDETGISDESPLMLGFANASKTLAVKIAGSTARILKYESSAEKSTAYAIIVLGPKAIAEQLATETDLFARLEPTKAYETLTEQIKAYEAFETPQP